MRANLQAAGVDIRHVRVTDQAPTGAAHISVDEHGQNAIVVVPGANGQLAPEDVAAARAVIDAAAIGVTQLETPDAVVAAVIDTGARVLLNAAPARPLSSDLLAGVSVLVVNEAEAALAPADFRGALVRTLGAGGASLARAVGSAVRVASRATTVAGARLPPDFS